MVLEIFVETWQAYVRGIKAFRACVENVGAVSGLEALQALMRCADGVMSPTEGAPGQTPEHGGSSTALGLGSQGAVPD